MYGRQQDSGWEGGHLWLRRDQNVLFCVNASARWQRVSVKKIKYGYRSDFITLGCALSYTY